MYNYRRYPLYLMYIYRRYRLYIYRGYLLYLLYSYRVHHFTNVQAGVCWLTLCICDSYHIQNYASGCVILGINTIYIIWKTHLKICFIQCQHANYKIILETRSTSLSSKHISAVTKNSQTMASRNWSTFLQLLFLKQYTITFHKCK